MLGFVVDDRGPIIASPSTPLIRCGFERIVWGVTGALGESASSRDLSLVFIEGDVVGRAVFWNALCRTAAADSQAVVIPDANADWRYISFGDANLSHQRLSDSESRPLPRHCQPLLVSPTKRNSCLILLASVVLARKRPRKWPEIPGRLPSPRIPIEFMSRAGAVACSQYRLCGLLAHPKTGFAKPITILASSRK